MEIQICKAQKRNTPLGNISSLPRQIHPPFREKIHLVTFLRRESGYLSPEPQSGYFSPGPQSGYLSPGPRESTTSNFLQNLKSDLVSHDA